jgi:hypothetical protein
MSFHSKSRNNEHKEKIQNFKIYKNQKIWNNLTPWIDDIFPPNENSLLGKNNNDEYLDQNEGKYKMIHLSEIEWKRINEIIPYPIIYEDIIDTSNIRYGRISYIYFLSVLTALSKFPSIFNKIILNQEYNSEGIYKIILFIDGEFQIVYIDDYFPCIKDSNVLYFIKSSNFSFWQLLIEKAWAKVNGGYQNIINLWPCDLLKALTGSACDVLIHDDLTKEQLFNELNDIDKNNGICISLTKNNNEVTKNGLINYHMYILIDTEKVELEKNNFLFLCKFCDPNISQIADGELSDTRGLLYLTERIKKKISSDKLELKKGEFWISIDDVKKLFLRSDICHMIFDGFSRIYTYKSENNKIFFPKIFNFYMPEEGMISISVLLEKNWHFHRELRDEQNPSSLIIAQYDNTNNEIKNILLTKYQSNEDTEISKFLNKGYYLVWAYTLNNSIKIRFCSDVKISIKYMGDDINFELIKNIIIDNRRKNNLDKINKKKIFYETENSFEKSGIGYSLCINLSDNIYQDWKINTGKLSGYYLLHPYNDKKNIDMKIEPNSNNIILGIKKQKYGEHWFNLIIEVNQFENEDQNNIKESNKEEKLDDNNNKIDINSYFSKDNNNFEIISGESTFSYEEIKLIKKYPKLDHWKLFLEKYQNKYPFIISELQQLKPLDNEKLDLIEISKDNTIYIGEADYIIRIGRGAMIFNNEGTIYIGYWDNGRQFIHGKVFDLNNNLIYDGEYKNGIKNGYGIYYYSNGERYEGIFSEGIREGKGIFYWKDGSKWEGYFKNDEMNGEGVFYDGKKSYNVLYQNGELMDN